MVRPMLRPGATSQRRPSRSVRLVSLPSGAVMVVRPVMRLGGRIAGAPPRERSPVSVFATNTVIVSEDPDLMEHPSFVPVWAILDTILAVQGVVP